MVRAKQSRQRVTGDSNAKELGRSNSQGAGGLQAVVDQEGQDGQMRQKQGGALVGMLGTELREGSGSQQG